MTDHETNTLAHAIILGPRAQKCRVCGCTDAEPCFDPTTGSTCFWAEPDLCSCCRDDLYMLLSTKAS